MTTPTPTTPSATPAIEPASATSSALQPSEPAASPSIPTTSPRERNALAGFEEQVGGRDSLVSTLAFAQLEPKQQHFVRLLADPGRTGDNLATICRAAGFRASDLIEVYRKASFAKAQAIAIGRAADAIPAVVDDLAVKSVDHVGRCPACDGKGQVGRQGAVCPTCTGTGRSLIDSDLERQRTLLDMMGLGKKQAPGTKIINTNAQVNASAVGSMFSAFVNATDTDAYAVDTPEVIDAEVACAESEG